MAEGRPCLQIKEQNNGNREQSLRKLLVSVTDVGFGQDRTASTLAGSRVISSSLTTGHKYFTSSEKEHISLKTAQSMKL